MRKYIKMISLALTVIISITMFVPVLANGEISVYLDDEKIQFDVAPLLINGRTMVPMRAIFEKLGAVVYWDNNTRTAIAQKGNTNVSIAIDDTILYKNSEPITLDVSAQLIGGRTLVPLRAISEAFDCVVFWNGDTQTVRILSSKSFLEPPKNIRVVRQANGSAYIQWDEVEGAEYYHFYYKEDGEPLFWYDEDEITGEKLRMIYGEEYTTEYWGLEKGKKYNIIVTSVKNGVESQDSEIFTFTSTTSSKEAVEKLRNWISNNYNYNYSDARGEKHIGHEITKGLASFSVSLIDNSKDVAVKYTNWTLKGNTNFTLYLSDASFDGGYTEDKVYSITGNIVKSASSNEMELAYNFEESKNTGNRDVMLNKLGKASEDTLIIFDNFLKENNTGLTLKDFELDYDLPEKSIQQNIAFDNLKDFVLVHQNDTVNNKPVFMQSDNSNDSIQYSIQYNDKNDTIELIMSRTYNNARIYSITTLTREDHTYQCTFSYYDPSNKSNTPDFDAIYKIDADSFGEKSNISFESISGNKANVNSYKEVAKFMNLEMLNYTEFVFDNFLQKFECSMADFGFDL